MVFEIRAPLKDDRTSIVFTVTKEHCARFETRCRFHCCRRIFKNVTIVDVFGREKLNTPFHPYIFILKCTLVFFQLFPSIPVEDTKRRQTIFLLFFFFFFLHFFRRGISHSDIYAWMCEQFYREVRSAHKSISTVDLIAPSLNV